MQSKIAALFLVMIAVLCPSCKDNRTDLEKLVSEWQGKQIELFRDLECRVMGEDTVAVDLLDKSCKILVYIDSSGCTECKLQLLEWKELIREVTPIRDRVSFVFCFQTEDLESVDLLFLEYGIRYPVFYDREGKMQQANHFPNEMRFQTFLLNPDNEVEIIGTPIGNPTLWKLYREHINNTLGIKDEIWPAKTTKD